MTAPYTLKIRYWSLLARPAQSQIPWSTIAASSPSITGRTLAAVPRRFAAMPMPIAVSATIREWKNGTMAMRMKSVTPSAATAPA